LFDSKGNKLTGVLYMYYIGSEIMSYDKTIQRYKYVWYYISNTTKIKHIL